MKKLAIVSLLTACGSVPPATPSRDARVPSADGVPIHYVVEGSGPAVVMAHCLACNLHYWDVAAADLARDHRVVRLDLAGHGESGNGRKAWTIEAFAADVRAVVTAAGVDRFTIVGHSMSGPTAIETALELGDRVTGVVPVDAVLDVDAPIPPDERAKALAAIRADNRGFTEKLLPTLLPKHPDPTVVARVRHDALAGDPEMTAAILGAVFAYSEATTLDRLSMPIVAIDSDVRPVALDHNRAHAPQFDARIVKDTGHWLMLDKPAEVTRVLRDVVESIERGVAKRRPRD